MILFFPLSVSMSNIILLIMTLFSFENIVRLDKDIASMARIQSEGQFNGTCYAYTFVDLLDSILHAKSHFLPKASKLIMAIENNILYQSRFQPDRLFSGPLYSAIDKEKDFPIDGGPMYYNFKVIKSRGYYPYSLVEKHLETLLENRYPQFLTFHQKLEHFISLLRIDYLRNDLKNLLLTFDDPHLKITRAKQALEEKHFLGFLRTIFTEECNYIDISKQHLDFKYNLMLKKERFFYKREILDRIKKPNNQPIGLHFCYNLFFLGRPPNLEAKEECFHHAASIIGKRKIVGMNKWQVLIKDSNKKYKEDFPYIPEIFEVDSSYKIWVDLDILLKSSKAYFWLENTK